MKKTFSIALMIAAIISLFYGTSFTGWIIFHKPAYKGKLIDAETKEPIEGAAVVAIYQKHPFISGPGGGSDSIVTVKEAVTDRNGEFRISSCFALMGPNSYEEYTNFIFYKPGYGSFTVNYKKLMGDARENYLLEENYGKKGDIIDVYMERKVGEGTYGVVELLPAKTWEERRKAARNGPLDNVAEKKWPIFKEMLDKEEKWLDQNQPRRR